MIRGTSLLLAIGGFIVWSSAFVFLYGMQGLGCALDLDLVEAGPFNLLSILLTILLFLHLAALAVLQWLGVRFWREGRGDHAASRFLGAVTCLTAAAGIVATIYIGAPVLVLQPCA